MTLGDVQHRLSSNRSTNIQVIAWYSGCLNIKEWWSNDCHLIHCHFKLWFSGLYPRIVKCSTDKWAGRSAEWFVCCCDLEKGNPENTNWHSLLSYRSSLLFLMSSFMGPEVSVCHTSYHSLGFLLGPLQLFAYLLLYTVDLKKAYFIICVCVCVCERRKGGMCVCVCVCTYCVFLHMCLPCSGQRTTFRSRFFFHCGFWGPKCDCEDYIQEWENALQVNEQGRVRGECFSCWATLQVTVGLLTSDLKPKISARGSVVEHISSTFTILDLIPSTTISK